MQIPDNILKQCESGFTPIRVTILEGAWKNKGGWIIGPKNKVMGNPIVTDDGFSLCWFDSEIKKEQTA